MQRGKTSPPRVVWSTPPAEPLPEEGKQTHGIEPTALRRRGRRSGGETSWVLCACGHRRRCGHRLLRSVRVQSGGRLVEQHQGRPGEDLDRDSDAAALAARQAARHVVADARVCHVREVEVDHRPGDELEPLLR